MVLLTFVTSCKNSKSETPQDQDLQIKGDQVTVPENNPVFKKIKTEVGKVLAKALIPRLRIANGGDRDEIDKDVNDTRPSIGRAVRDVFFRFWDLRNHYA